jgi:photosystem II stability/assembly factor-like uncharacterized protein
MRSPAAPCAALLACLLSTTASAAPAAAPAPPTLEALLSRHLEALGGADRLAAVRSLRLVGKQIYGDGSGRVELRWQWTASRPGLLREETTQQGLTAVKGWDGTTGWRYSPFEGRREAEKAPADATKSMARQADLDGPLLGWKAKGLKAESLGLQDVDGTPAHEIRITFPDGDVEEHYLDAAQYLVIRIERRTQRRGTLEVEVEERGAYTPVAGVMVPFSREFGPKNGPPWAVVVVERADANVPLSAAAVLMPATPPAATPVPPPDASTATLASAPKPPPAPAPAGPPAFDTAAISGLGARNIGSATMSGRIAAVAAADDGHGGTIVYAGAASGGVWRSLDGATTFLPVFDKQPVQSIGAIAIDPRNQKTVWVGTGEAWTRNSASVGDGIYRSDDGGETWSNMGLRESERITKIVVHPKDSNTVYACVPGKLWSDSKERGLYKTSDGGKRWSLVLAGPNGSTGCSGVTLDPSNPERVVAGLWDFRRQGWTFRSGGDGPAASSGSALMESRDGGTTWAALDVAGAGLPKKPWGRIEVSFAPSEARVLYAFIESPASALYRSSDGGRTWEPRDRSQAMVWRPFYFARLVVDPTNPERLFKTDGELIASEDGGRSFQYASGGSHGDWHDLWIDPRNPKHVIGGDDGGLWVSRDGGSKWWKVDSLPVSQFYHASVDAEDPYRVCGGLQDNDSWCGDSAFPGGITNARWDRVGPGGDGFWVFVDPTDPAGVYAETQGGYLTRLDRRTRALRDLQPKAGPGEKLRFNWNTPIHLSPTRPGTLYLGSQFLFRTRDRGETWDRISPDLTSNDPKKQRQEQSGGITVDNSAAEMHTTIYAISESPRDGETIWAGTDDGRLQVTRDGAKTWTDVAPRIPGLPPASWVSWVEAGPHDAAVAYAAFDRHTFGDMTPWVFRTGDAGRTWTRIAGPSQGIRGYAHVIKEDPSRPGLLYLGTELGLWISPDGGVTWAEFKGSGFPSVAVRDLAFATRDGDLVIATHGRGIWIVDDLAPLRALTDAVMGRDVAILPGRPAQQRMGGVGGWVEGDARFVGENPSGGAVITLWQRSRHLFGPLTVEILDPGGQVIDQVPATKKRGLNRLAWTMREPPPRVPRAASVAGGASMGPRVLPGDYRVRVRRGAEVVEAPLRLVLDHRATYSLEDRAAQHQALRRVYLLFGKMSDLAGRLVVVRDGAAARAEVAGKRPEVASRLRALAGSADGLRKKIVATTEGGAVTGEERLREHAAILYSALDQWEGRPPAWQVARIGVLEQELDGVGVELDGLLTSQVPALDRALRGLGLEPLPTATPAPDEAELSPASLEWGFGRFLGERGERRGGKDERD